MIATGQSRGSIGAALVWSAGTPRGKVVHTFDDRLAAAARREGFDVPA